MCWRTCCLSHPSSADICCRIREYADASPHNAIGEGWFVKATNDDIRFAYRLLLGREPDESGFRNYARMVSTTQISVSDVAATFLDSAEFHARQANQNKVTKIEQDGYSIFVSAGDSAIGRSILENGAWERHVSEKLKRILLPSMTFVDIGANIGYFTAMAAHAVGPSGKVVAIEPMDKNAQLIYATCHYNDFNNVHVLQCGASDRHAFVPLDTGAGTSNGSLRYDDNKNILPQFIAQTFALDDLLPNIDSVDVIKMDIEGFEPHAWKGFEKTITRCKPRILTEFHPKCLAENGKYEPISYLEMLFSYARVLTILEPDGGETTMHNPTTVMNAWREHDRALMENGCAHLDIYVAPLL